MKETLSEIEGCVLALIHESGPATIYPLVARLKRRGLILTTLQRSGHRQGRRIALTPDGVHSGSEIVARPRRRGAPDRRHERSFQPVPGRYWGSENGRQARAPRRTMPGTLPSTGSCATPWRNADRKWPFLAAFERQFRNHYGRREGLPGLVVDSRA